MEEILGLQRGEFEPAIWYMDEQSSMAVNVDADLAKNMFGQFMKLHSLMQQTQMDIKARCLVIGCCLREIDDQKLYQYICPKGKYSTVGYSSFYKFCQDVYGFKKRTAARLVAVAREFCGADGGIKIDYLNFSYSQLSELLTIEEKYRPRITIKCSVRDIRALGKYYKNNVPKTDQTVEDDLNEWRKICQEEKERANAKKNALTFIPSKKSESTMTGTVPTSAPSENIPAQGEDFEEEDEREIVTPVEKKVSYEAVRNGLLRQLALLRECEVGVAWKKTVDLLEEALQKNAPFNGR